MSSIKFNLSDSKTLDFHKTASLNDVLQLGAVALTCKSTFPNQDVLKKEYATDDEGLETLILHNEEIINHLHTSLATLGILQAYVDVNELEVHELRNLGWLIHSLSELAASVSFHNSEMTYHLETKKPM